MSGAGDMIDERLLMKELKNEGVFKFGRYTLKSGQFTPIYIDLRVLFTCPRVLRLTADYLCDLLEEKCLDYDYIVGVPYAALPLSTLVSDRLGKPMLLRRKEVKSHGTKKLIEGNFERGKKALVIEDVVTAGTSIMETIVSLRNEGLICETAICVLDREQGGFDQIKREGTNLYSLLTMTKILDYLNDIEMISVKEKENILYQLSLPPPSTIDTPQNSGSWLLNMRKDTAPHSLNKKLIDIMMRKKTCLCLAADFTKCEEVLRSAEKMAEYICAVKIHADILEDFNDEFVKAITVLADSLDFIIIEDRKLADIGNTTDLQLTKGIFKISSWSHIVTVHALSGQSVLNIIDRPETKLCGCLLVVELSSENMLTNTKGYIEASVELAKNNRDIVCGFVCQKRCTSDPNFLYWTSGVHMDATTDGIGQRWRTIERAIGDEYNDIVMVGRAVTGAPDMNTQIRRYRDAAWERLITRLHSH